MGGGLLILTQKVDIDDDVLGFFHGWILEFAKNCEKVTVVCLEKGEFDLPENVAVFSLGKEKIGNWKLEIGKKLLYIFRFYKYIWKERRNYDIIFVHMNSEYVILGAPLWKLFGKKIGLWYAHKAVNLKLRVAEKFADKIFTVTKEGFRLKSKKLVILGHGIDIGKCQMQNENCKIKEETFFKVIYVGRISPIKNQKLAVEAADILINKEKMRNVKFKFIGAPIYEKDKIFFNELTNLAKEKKLNDYIEFAGSIPHEKIFEEYSNADLSINLCPTGGPDKAVLESMARGCLVFAYNKAFENILPKELILNTSDKNELAEKIKWAVNLGDGCKKELRKVMIEEIRKNHNLWKLIRDIVREL
ncbi:hypothetical protein A2Y83_03310 [Candidatus Falkowbacteria bacterium RBG_13_39_14]|uniref:Glycosyl transferase family 1 domain-containing protein n=1 Tax=Candidatus Falkowbacteria bacterium RBG_13_39_14 TaxID=1797985 RepID=A0A1F5S5L9_9BACT|nr:MAG: hypothetical protein A2Y83_03310 [Candidatus Falkowbacteria bacterium RBG_13_39_14]